METRGVYGFYKNEVTKVASCKYSIEPVCLGHDVVRFIQDTTIEEMNQIFNKVILVKDKGIPTDEQINEFKDILYRLTKTDNWYETLRHFEVAGDLRIYKKNLRYMVDSKNLIKESAKCLWGYIINLDNNELEIYKGHQTTSQDNRYRIDKSKNGYYNCKLLKSIPFNEANKEILVEIQTRKEAI
jgi:hypothetical protein